MPNIQGRVTIGNNGETALCSGGTGALITEELKDFTKIMGVSSVTLSNKRQNFFLYDASRYNSIYNQSNNRVIPYSLKTRYYIKF